MKATQVQILLFIIGLLVIIVFLAIVGIVVAEGAGTPIPPTPPYSEMLTPTPDPYPGMAPTATPKPYNGAVVVGHDMKGYPDEDDCDCYDDDTFTPDDAGLWAFLWDLFTGG